MGHGITYGTHWWERRLIKMFGRKVYQHGAFVGYVYKGKFYQWT